MSNFSIDIEKQLSKLGKDIQQFVEKTVSGTQDLSDFYPDCDIVEGADHYSIRMDLPGLAKDEVNVTLKHRVITISGERRASLEEGEQNVRSERRYGAFSRSFAVPEAADESSVAASFKNGVLNLKFSKKESQSEENDAQSIPIQ